MALIGKVKRPFADMLYAVGVKDCDTYLPTDEEVGQMIQQSQQAAQAAQQAAQENPSPEDQLRLAKVRLENAKTQQVQAEMTGTDAETQLDYLAIASGTPKVYS
jgi:hypothetical protein